MTTDDIGSLQVTPKRPRVWGDDHTDTMLEKKAAMAQGIVLDRPIRYTPQHRRSARGIVAGIVLGGALDRRRPVRGVGVEDVWTMTNW